MVRFVVKNLSIKFVGDVMDFLIVGEWFDGYIVFYCVGVGMKMVYFGNGWLVWFK